MKKISDALIDLLKVKSLITLMMVITGCLLVAVGRMDTTVYVGTLSSIITYYFTRKDMN